MRKVLLVFLKDTFYSGQPGAAQWHYVAEDSHPLRVVVLGSGALIVFRLNPDGHAQSHLAGERADRVAFFPAGGWSGYAWEEIPGTAMSRASAAASGILTAH